VTVRDPIAAALGNLAVAEPVRSRLERYVAALLARNATMNLTAARTPEAVAEHVRDSLAVAEFAREPLVDVGSGGGFPGVPIALATGMRVTLVESVAKKAAFLKELARDQAIAVEVVCARAEDIGRDGRYRARFASATARAVAGVTTVLELTVPLLEVGGVALLQRGRIFVDERIAANDAALVLGAIVEDEVALPLQLEGVVDGEDQRRLLVVRKTLATGPRFPRRAGIPTKRPLCLRPATGD